MGVQGELLKRLSQTFNKKMTLILHLFVHLAKITLATFEMFVLPIKRLLDSTKEHNCRLCSIIRISTNDFTSSPS